MAKGNVKTENDAVCVMAIDPYTRLSVTCTSCDRKDAQRYAKYYSSIGYRVKTLEYGEELDRFHEMERRVRMRENQNLNLAMAGGGI